VNVGILRSVQQAEKHLITTPRPVQTYGEGDPFTILTYLSGGGQRRLGKGNRNQPVPGILLLKGLSRGRDSLEEDREGVTRTHGGCQEFEKILLGSLYRSQARSTTKTSIILPEIGRKNDQMVNKTI
jgi:hypothetical protein